MTIATILRLFFLYSHLLFCCFALCYLISTDVKILKNSINNSELKSTATNMYRLLLALWATGISLVLIDTHGDLAVFATKHKLITKILCVIMLSINAVALHHYAFPKLTSLKPLSKMDWRVIMCLGAISTSSWLFAAFLGIAKPLSDILSLQGFISLYVVVMSSSIIGALIISDKIYRPSGAELNSFAAS